MRNREWGGHVAHVRNERSREDRSSRDRMHQAGSQIPPYSPFPIPCFNPHFGVRTGNGTLHTSMCPAGRLYHSSRRLRRDSTTVANVLLSVRSNSSLVRSASGTSLASLADTIGTYCSGFS